MTLYFGDLHEGMEFRSAGRTITESDIASFAGLSGDFNPLHTDAEWVAANTDYPGRIAHGLLVLAVSSGLRTPGLDDLHVLAFLAVERRMKAATLPGDTIRQTQVVRELRASRSRPGSGVVGLDVTVTNQKGTVVQVGGDTLLVGGRSHD
ncbi:MaoC/PaaZ C-terminal domain-containing protein [Spirillospora sp. CA-255316]